MYYAVLKRSTIRQKLMIAIMSITVLGLFLAGTALTTVCKRAGFRST